MKMPSPDPTTGEDTHTDESQRLLENKDYEKTDEDNPEKIVTCSGRLMWAWLAAFIYMFAYQSSFFAFGQFVYIKLQKESYPNVTIDSTKSLCETNTSSLNYLIQEDVQQKAAAWGIYFYLAGGFAAVVSNFVLGSFTDRFGRKFLFIFPCFGSIFRTVLATILMKVDLPLYYYLVGYFVEGCTGQVFSMFQVCYIYASDITVPGKQRSFAIVAMELAFGLGTAIPAVVIGYVLTAMDDFLIPMYISCGLLLVALLIMFTLPETFPKEVRAKRQYSTLFENLKDAVDLYFSKKNSGKRWMYIIMLVVFALTCYDLFGRVAVEGLFVLNSPFCFGPDKLGLFNAVKTGITQVVSIVLVVVLLMFTSDEVVAIIGCISYGASFIIEALATTELHLYIVSVVGCCGLLTIPMVRSIMSQMTSAQKQGAVFASMSSMETTINLISAVSSNSIYLATVSFYRGFIFLVYAALNGVCLLLIVIFMVGSRKMKRKYIEIDVS